MKNLIKSINSYFCAKLYDPIKNVDEISQSKLSDDTFVFKRQSKRYSVY